MGTQNMAPPPQSRQIQRPAGGRAARGGRRDAAVRGGPRLRETGAVQNTGRSCVAGFTPAGSGSPAVGARVPPAQTQTADRAAYAEAPLVPRERRAAKSGPRRASSPAPFQDSAEAPTPTPPR